MHNEHSEIGQGNLHIPDPFTKEKTAQRLIAPTRTRGKLDNDDGAIQRQMNHCDEDKENINLFHNR